jgi:hypothetical protein
MESVTILAKKNNKNKVTSTANSGTTNSYSLTKAAPRVSTNINIPVRQQIAWAKAYKRLMSSSGVSNKGNTRKFRQEKGPKPIEEEYIEIDYKAAKPPALFIDGYNIIGYINSVEGRNIPLEDARDCLISDLTVLQTATGWFIEVIFDAYKVKAPEKTEIVDSIQVTYTGTDETADNHIERRFQELSKSGFTNMVVAIDDNVLGTFAWLLVQWDLGFYQLRCFWKSCASLTRGGKTWKRKWRRKRGSAAQILATAFPMKCAQRLQNSNKMLPLMLLLRRRRRELLVVLLWLHLRRRSLVKVRQTMSYLLKPRPWAEDKVAAIATGI